jgi:hypothetical protein
VTAESPEIRFSRLPFFISGFGGVSLSDDHRRLAAAQSRNEIALCDEPMSGVPIRIHQTLLLDSKLIDALMLNRSGERLLAPCEDGVRIYSWQGEFVSVIPDAIAAVFIDDDNVLAVRNRPAPEVAIFRVVDKGSPLLQRVETLPARAGLNYQCLFPRTSKGFSINELWPPDHSKRYWVDQESLAIGTTEGESVVAVSPSGRTIVSNGDRGLALVDLETGGELLLSAYYEGAKGRGLVENCALLDDDDLVCRIEGFGFVRMWRQRGGLAFEDQTALLESLAKPYKKPRVMHVANGSIVAVPYADGATLLLDMKELPRSSLH